MAEMQRTVNARAMVSYCVSVNYLANGRSARTSFIDTNLPYKLPINEYVHEAQTQKLRTRFL